MKKKVKKSKDEVIEIFSDELSLIIESLKEMRKNTQEEMFYTSRHPEGFYRIYLERYHRLINKLNVRIPKAVFLKMPKF